MPIRIHATAEVDPTASIGEGTSIWNHAQVREGTSVGKNCILSKGVYIDAGVSIGDNVKIQNYVSVYHGVTIEDGVFIGPHVCFTNDLQPRAINPDGTRQGMDDWRVIPTLVQHGASLGANSTIICGVTIGRWAMVGAGSVVTRCVPDHGLVWGNPARLHGFVCRCGEKLPTAPNVHNPETVTLACSRCEQTTAIKRPNFELLFIGTHHDSDLETIYR